MRGPDSSLRYEALGRVMAALSSEAEMLEACRDLAWWRGNGDTWHVEWRDGPYASEVAALLVDRVLEPVPGGGPAADPADGPARGSAGQAEPGGPATPSIASLDVLGVRFLVRAIDPLGLERLRARPGIWRLSEALNPIRHPIRRTGSRRHWEELLGG